MSQHDELTEKEINDVGFQIINMLDGVPIGQALYVLKNTKELLLDCHIVDIRGDRLNEKIDDFSRCHPPSDE